MKPSYPRRPSQRPTLFGKKNRRGTATVELAIILPVLLTMTLGTIDVCTAIFLRESAVLAAYEGARRGVGRDRTNAQVVARVEEFLNQRNIQYGGNVVEISNPGFDTAETLENVTVTVNIPVAGNTLIPSEIIGDLTVSAGVTMVKEYKNLN
ncbi:TadE-like protein [Rubripirellula amarantea]|uniref:TadE-like protein n=1 Tax=Rubripirellula amarantea TaxID=2527999 RepID=A0A5C5WU51_9BACT|nr:TadE/TadG family type IV pilus assembly protein [Rubripirellula amarantea]TWT54108.1 TadE-like protein [Rubripirellula amarantea]